MARGKMNHKRFCVLGILLMLAAIFAAPQLFAQSQTTGDVTGVVSDQSGGSVPDAKVDLKDLSKGSVQVTQTNKDGVYHFYLLTPGPYSVTVSAPNFQALTRLVTVDLGQIETLNLALNVAAANTTVTVTEEAPLVQTADGNVSTTIGQQQISEVPNPGNDLSAIAQLAPGSVMNTNAGGGLGNFSSFGVSASSNLFTLDGMDDNDPFLNLNNSGATNLALGTNEIQEATIVSTGYSAQYGGLAGANINYVTKSGGNNFHGNAVYYWNGRAMNAQDWFLAGQPKTFSNANQWAGSLGGPIKKDKAFFFFNTEGLRVILPTVFPETLVPTTEFETATIANLTAKGLTASIPFYNQMFGLFNAAAAGKTPDGAPNACPAGITTSTGFCTFGFNSGASNLTHEAQYMGRVDYNLGQNDRAFVRVAYDKGVQASITDPISPLFNVGSTQPQWSAQFNETHTFGASTSNQFIASLLWYSAIFGVANPAATAAAFPTTITFNDGSLTNLGGICCGGLGNSNFPQGRNVTQYQFSDDVSHTTGNHTLSFGAKFRRDDVSDHDFAVGQTGLIGVSSLQDFFNGEGPQTNLGITFPSASNQPIALYSLAFYAQDQWRVKPNLTLTLALRAEHQSNPVCQTNCIARFDGPFVGGDHDPSVPYNQVIQTGLHRMLEGLDNILWQPRIGIAWQPFGTQRNTVVRGGVGLFNDAFPGVLVDGFAGNAVAVNTFVASGAPISPAETVGGNLFSAAAADNAAFLAGFANGLNFNQISAAVPGFTPPSLFTADRHTHIAQYQKWNLQIEQGFGANTSVSVGYVGNHGIHEIIQNNGLNGFCDPTSGNPDCPGVPFIGLPTAAPDPAFGTVTQYQSGGISNYNGLAVSAKHRFTGVVKGVVGFNYTYGHAQDLASNGGITNIPFSFANSFATPQDPNNPRGSYGPADYDVRHTVNANYVLLLPIRRALMGHGWAPLVDGWQVSGTVFYHTGMPFTVFDGPATGALRANNYGSFIYPQIVGSVNTNCGASATTVPCFGTDNFVPSGSEGSFSTGLRNRFRGPGYADSDFTVMKNTAIPHWEGGKFGIGFQFYNLFNHPNFFTPTNGLAPASASNPFFGLITSAVSAPTSILGAGLGGDSSPRIIQLKAQVSF
jgi:outer membrane receptor protein involved in Fe transport